MISIRNVTKYYPIIEGGVHYVFRDITLEIPDNKNVGILGPNGAGKSTLLRMIGGAEAPNSGVIDADSSISWPLGIKSGFQGSLTGRQNVLFVCQINGLSRAETKDVISAVQDFAELGEYFDMPVKSYSSGMRARLGFGVSINFDFDCYLIDELTSVGDAVFRKKASEEFKRIKESSSLIFASHSLGTLRKYCESAIVLWDGAATYYEDVRQGISAYMEQIKSKTGIALDNNTKKAATRNAAKKIARKMAKKIARKMAKKMATKMATKMINENAPGNNSTNLK